MAVITPFFDVVAGVAILAGRSSLLDTGIFKTANTNFTIRHLLALGFIGYGGWNLWKIERAQDKLKKSLGAEDYTEIGICDYGLVCDQNIPTPLNEYGICQECQEQWEYENEMFPLEEGAESFGADGHYLRKSKYDDNGRWDIYWEGDSRYRNYAITLKDNPNDIRIVVEYSDDTGYSLAIPQPDTIKNFSTMNEVLEYLDNMGDVRIGVFTHRFSTNRSYPTVGDWGAESLEVKCENCQEVIGTEEEVYDEESVEWYNIDGEVYCPACKNEVISYEERFGVEDNAPYAGVFEKMEVTFKIQDADYATFYYTTEIPSGLRRHSDEHIVSYIWGDEYELKDDNWFYLPYDWNGVGEHYLAKVMNKTLKAESFGADLEKCPKCDSGNLGKEEMYYCYTCGNDDASEDGCSKCGSDTVGEEEMDYCYNCGGQGHWFNAESFGAEPMLVQSDGMMVELMGFDGSYRSDGEVKVGYTTAAELGFEPKQLKPVMWVWDDIEGYGAFMATEDIRFV